jgi:hypothetical protein
MCLPHSPNRADLRDFACGLLKKLEIGSKERKQFFFEKKNQKTLLC